MSTVNVVKRSIDWVAKEPDKFNQCLTCRHMEWRIEGKYKPWCLKNGFFTLSHATCGSFHVKEIQV